MSIGECKKDSDCTVENFGPGACCYKVELLKKPDTLDII